MDSGSPLRGVRNDGAGISAACYRTTPDMQQGLRFGAVILSLR